MLASEIKKYSRKGILKNTEWSMEKLVVNNNMNICKNKVKEVLRNIKFFAQKIGKNKSNNNKNKFLNSEYDIDKCEKYKLALLYRFHTGKKLY